MMISKKASTMIGSVNGSGKRLFSCIHMNSVHKKEAA